MSQRILVSRTRRRSASCFSAALTGEVQDVMAQRVNESTP
jgi:hypothetical protein